MSDVKAIVDLLTEEGDDFSVKELFTAETPNFEYTPVSATANDSSAWWILDVKVGGKWIGRVFPVERDLNKGGYIGSPQGRKWGANWLPETPFHPQPQVFDSPEEAALWLWHHRELYMPNIKEADEEGDMSGKEMNVTPYRTGDRVRVLTGSYAGELGTVVGKSSFGAQQPGDLSFWVHFDFDPDVNAGVVYQADSLEPVADAPEPKFIRVKILSGEFAGQLGYITGTSGGQGSVESEKFAHVHPDGYSDDWRTIKVPISDVKPVNESEEILQIVQEMTDDDDMKELGGDMLSVIVQHLTDAGFNVNHAKEEGEYLSLRFTWSAPTAALYLNGAKRAREILSQFINLPSSHFTGHRTGGVAQISIRQRMEQDHTLWQARLKPGYNPSFVTFYEILFQGQVVGEIYTTEHGAQLVRSEMSALNEIIPFNENFKLGDNAFGTGPAVRWWRATRQSLPSHAKKAEHHVDKALLGQK